MDRLSVFFDMCLYAVGGMMLGVLIVATFIILMDVVKILSRKYMKFFKNKMEE